MLIFEHLRRRVNDHRPYSVGLILVYMVHLQQETTPFALFPLQHSRCRDCRASTLYCATELAIT